MSELYFRETTAADYDDVVSIREMLYDGLDYIPGRYHKLLETNTGFAGFIDNSMVSFMFIAVIDDGKHILIQSARVRKEYEGQGIFTKMRKFFMNSISPQTDKYVFVIASLCVCEKLLQKSGKLIFKRNALRMTTSKTSLVSLLLSKPSSSILQQVDAIYLEEIITTNSETKFLFPESRIVLYNVLYEFVLTNVERILSRSNMLATKNAKQDHCDKNQLLMVSACTHNQCECGTVVHLDLFGNIDNENVVQDHLITQLSRCLEDCDTNIVLYLTYSTHHATAALQGVLSKLKWRKMGEEVLFGMEITE